MGSTIYRFKTITFLRSGIMTDYEYIYQQMKKAHYSGWDDEELRKCVDMLPTLSREEQLTLYRSKWVDERLKRTVFKVLFADKVGKREERIRNLKTEDLIVEFQDKKGGNIALIRKEMRERFRKNEGTDRRLIGEAFNASLKSDQQWVRSQIRKEQYGGSGNKSQSWKK